MNLNLKPVALAAAIIGTALLIGTAMSNEQAQADRDVYRYELEQAESRPFPTVTRTVKITLTPKPAPTVTVWVTERAARSAARSTVRKAKADSSVGDKATLACIRKHESGNNYRDVSATGKFRGAYHFHRGYAPVWAERAGYGEWSGKTPDKWPPAVQDAVAYDMGRNNGYAAWDKHTSYNCPGFR